MRRLLLVLALLLGAHQALAADGFIQVPPDSTGKQIDSSAVSLRPTDVAPVYRQRYNVCDNVAPDCAPVSQLGGLRVSQGGAWAVTSVPEQLQRPLVGVLDPLGMVRRSVVIGDGGSSYAAVVKSGVVVDSRQPSLAVSISPNGNAVVASGSVSVTNFPGTQPVSGSVSVSNFPATQVVSGTGSFTVTGTVTSNQGTANATPWNDNVAQINGVVPLMGNGVTGTGSQRVTIASDNTAFAVNNTQQGTASQNVAQFGGVAVSTGTGASGTGIPRVTVANDSNVLVTPPTLTKATQGATGFSTQALLDAGRTAISLYANNVASGVTATETIITLTQSSGTGATTSAASFTPTSGKTFRINSITVASRGNATAVAQITTFSLRMNTGGACVVTSTPILFSASTATPATSSAWDRFQLPIPDGYEIAGNGTVSICISANAVFVTSAPTWFVNITGFLY